MAILGPLLALLGRFLGRMLTTTLGWASTLLFGRVAQSRQVWLAALTFGSLIWIVVLAGVILPGLGTFLLTFVPVPSWVDPNVVRLVMLLVAVLLPGVLGVLTILIADPADRPTGPAAVLVIIGRGYLLAPALACTLTVLAVAGTIRKLDSLLHQRQDAHVAAIVRPGRYEHLVAATSSTLEAVRLVNARRSAPRVLAVPARLLARIAGGGMRRLVPDELVELRGPRLSVLVYPSDLAMTGQKAAVAQARAVISRDLRPFDAWFTTVPEAQRLEDRMAELERLPKDNSPLDLREIDRALMHLTVPQEEWEILYRRRLQLAAERSTQGAGPLAKPSDVRPPDRESSRLDLDPGAVLGLALTALTILDLFFVVTRRARRRP